jgi:hypothetical protein
VSLPHRSAKVAEDDRRACRKDLGLQYLMYGRPIKTTWLLGFGFNDSGRNEEDQLLGVGVHGLVLE